MERRTVKKGNVFEKEIIMKRRILLCAVIFLAYGSLAYSAQEPEPALHGSIGATWTSKYIWRGFEVYGSKSAIHPEVDLNLFGTGFGINATGHRASSGYEMGERWDYSLYYLSDLFKGESYETICRLAYIYYNYPDLSAHTRDSIDLQELQAYIALPSILGVKGLVPAYVLVKLWPSNSDSPVGAKSSAGGTASGFAHIFMLDYGLPITCPLTGVERTLNLHSELVYNDCVSPAPGYNVDHDWTNAVFGVSTNVNLTESLVFTPGIYHQVTMDDSVNRHKDETWASLGMMFKF
jgi:hypothetical protein